MNVLSSAIANMTLLGASEFVLTVTLVVFVMITVALTALLVILCISKNFRAVFFRETAKKKKAAKARSREKSAAQRHDDGDDGIENTQAPRADKTEQTPPHRTQRKRRDVFDTVETVPLNAPPANSADDDEQVERGTTYRARKTDIYKTLQTVVIPLTNTPSTNDGKKSTSKSYAARNVTATRSRYEQPSGGKTKQSGATSAKADGKTRAAGKNVKPTKGN